MTKQKVLTKAGLWKTCKEILIQRLLPKVRSFLFPLLGFRSGDVLHIDVIVM
jgi:hypothetical protein